jgi:DNA transformation protein and related proteins
MDGIDGIIGRLSGLGDITARAMFGGHGLYWRGMIFGIAHAGRLYFKVGEDSMPAFEARGMGPFRPNERQTLKSYDEVPPEVLADREALLSWAGEAIRAGRSSERPG